MLFHTVPFFFLSMVAQKTSKLRYSDWLLRNFNQSESGYLSYHGEQNGGHHAKEHWKLSWKLVSKNSLHFVGSHHSEKQTVTCVLLTCSQLWCACNQEISLRRCRTSPDEIEQVQACRYSRLLAWKTRNGQKWAEPESVNFELASN